MSDTISDTNIISAHAPIDAAEYGALTSGTALLPRPDAGVLRLTDADRQDFLQRMTSNNITALQPGQSAVTVLTSPTARVLYVFTVIARADDLLLLPAPGQSQALSRHLRGQIFFMDKVKVHDLGDQWTRLRLMGPQAGKALAAFGIDATTLTANRWVTPENSQGEDQDDLIIVAQPQYEVPGFELVVPVEKKESITSALLAAGARVVSGDAYHARRIEVGRPAGGAELVEDYNPLEAGLAWACAENKGCYTGQEIIARQITYDKVTKTLTGLKMAGIVAPGSDVTVEGRTVGTVTSVVHSPTLDAPVALAIIKRPHNAPGTNVQVGDHAATVVALPFEEA